MIIIMIIDATTIAIINTMITFAIVTMRDCVCLLFCLLNVIRICKINATGPWSSTTKYNYMATNCRNGWDLWDRKQT